MPEIQHLSWSFIKKILTGEQIDKDGQRGWYHDPSQISLIRIQHSLTNSIWATYRNDERVMRYFPEKFYREIPPKSYFWRISALVKPNDYDKFIIQANERVINTRRILRNSITMTNEAIQVFDTFTKEDLALLGIINS